MNVADQTLRDTSYQFLRSEIDPRSRSFWFFMHRTDLNRVEGYRPCCSVLLLKEMHHFLQQCLNDIALNKAENELEQSLNHLILASDANVFNLGGDLDLFGRLIRRRDRDALLAYAVRCVQGAYDLHRACLEQPLHTVALVQGDALGGGFEMALSCKTIVAEEGVGMGFPEVLFGLFPGMGAYTFLKRRVGKQLAEDMMLNGTIYSSGDLHRMGVIDVLVPKGEGIQAVSNMIRQNQRIARARMAMHQVREVADPIQYDELLRIGEIWVDTALQLGEKSLKTMERLVRMQQKRSNEVQQDSQKPDSAPIESTRSPRLTVVA
ncbi:MAG: crotonase/enoyl-CoA hydratase family protein [Rudaea sp.]|uniref:crotonase/enoyl-CoA hydratase family protein n=1 Tax=Rudaea sp. TaxID=2136325 RepID=UPI0039E68BB7